MDIREIDRREAVGQPDDKNPAPNVIVAACESNLGVLTPDDGVFYKSKARDIEVRSQRILEITTDDHHLSPLDLSLYLIHGLDSHPIVQGELAQYVYWPHASDPSNFTVVLYSATEMSLLLQPQEKYDWRKNIRIATTDDRPEWKINHEVFAECVDPRGVRAPNNERNLFCPKNTLMVEYSQSDLALKLALEMMAIEHLIVD